MTMRFACAVCGRAFQLDDEEAGKRVKCPDCGRANNVPVMGSTVRYIGTLFGDGLAFSPIGLGAFAVFFCWVPILGAMMSVPLGLVGIALGVLGLPVGVLRSRQATMRSLGGIGLCVLAIIASLASTGVFIRYLKNAAQHAAPGQQQQQEPSSSPSNPQSRDNRVMTIDGQRADRPPPANGPAFPVPPEATKSSEKTIPIKKAGQDP